MKQNDEDKNILGSLVTSKLRVNKTGTLGAGISKPKKLFEGFGLIIKTYKSRADVLNDRRILLVPKSSLNFINFL